MSSGNPGSTPDGSITHLTPNLGPPVRHFSSDVKKVSKKGVGLRSLWFKRIYNGEVVHSKSVVGQNGVKTPILTSVVHDSHDSDSSEGSP
jgi:hypothetical protein